MEASFGTSFSDVRVHVGDDASQVGALAYARGSDLYFAPGAYDPSSSQGQELLGHELTHVVQQRQGRVAATMQAKGLAINDDPALEREADQLGARAARGEQVGLAAPGAAQASSTPVAQGFFTLDPQQAQKLATRGSGTRFLRQQPGLNQDYLTDEKQLIVESTKTMQALRISDDGQLAVQATPGNVDAKTFFAEPGKIAASNGQLEDVHSQFRLKDTGKTLSVPDLTGGMHQLHQVLGEDAKDSRQVGKKLLGSSQCIEMAQQVTGGMGKLDLGPVMQPPRPNEKDLGNSLAAYVTGYANAEEDRDRELMGQKATFEASSDKGDVLSGPEYVVTLQEGITKEDVDAEARGHTDLRGKPIFQVDEFQTEVPGSYTVRGGSGKSVQHTQEMLEKTLTKGVFGKTNLYNSISQVGTSSDIVIESIGKTDKALWEKLNKLYYEDDKLSALSRTTKVDTTRVRITVKAGIDENKLEDLGESSPGSLHRRISVDQGYAMLQGLAKYIAGAEHHGVFHKYGAKFYRGEGVQQKYLEAIAKRTDDKTEVAEQLRLNEHASPEVGGAFAIAPVGQLDQHGAIKDLSRDEWKAPGAPYHWAGVVARSGNDVITLENYARGANQGMGGLDPRNYFAMYGPAREIEIGDDGLQEKQPDDPEAWKKGTFHGTWGGEYPNALTVAFRPNNEK